ncbi:MAG: hypothetical protein Kow00120_03750 [Anaerolineae bacterium]
MSDPAQPADIARADETTHEPAEAAEYQPQWGAWTRQFVIVLLVVAGVYALTLIGPVIQMLIMAFILAFLMYAPARAIARRTPIPFGGAVALLYLALVLVVLFLLLVLIPTFVTWVNDIVDNVERAYADLVAALEAYTPDQGIAYILGFEVDFNFLIEPLRPFVLGREQAAPPAEETGEAALDEPTQPQGDGLFGEGGLLETVDLQQILDGLLNVAGAITSTVTSAITSVAGLAITLIMAVFLSFLILIDLQNAEGALDRWVPRRYHREYRLLLYEIVRVWNGFFRGQLIIGVIIGVLTWVQLVLMGVPGAEILAFFTGAVSLIPTIGGLAALVPLTLVPLLQGSTVFPEMSNVAFALIVVGVNLALQQVIWNVVAPKILGEAVDLPLAVIIVGVFIGSALGGILGAFLVAPIMGTIRVILLYLFSKIGGVDPFPGREPPEPMPTFAEARVRIPRRRRS